MENYIIILRPLRSTTPPEIRMRRALKFLLRSCELRCTDIRQTDADAQDASGAVQPCDDAPKAAIAPQREAEGGSGGSETPDDSRNIAGSVESKVSGEGKGTVTGRPALGLFAAEPFDFSDFETIRAPLHPRNIAHQAI